MKEFESTNYLWDWSPDEGKMTVVEISSHHVEIRKSQFVTKPQLIIISFQNYRHTMHYSSISLKNHFYNLFNDKIIFKARK